MTATTMRYSRRLANIAREAAKLGMFVDISEPSETTWGPRNRGRYVLRYADDRSNVDPDSVGVNLSILEAQLECLTAEDDPDFNPDVDLVPVTGPAVVLAFPDPVR